MEFEISSTVGTKQTGAQTKNLGVSLHSLTHCSHPVNHHVLPICPLLVFFFYSFPFTPTISSVLFQALIISQPDHWVVPYLTSPVPTLSPLNRPSFKLLHWRGGHIALVSCRIMDRQVQQFSDKCLVAKSHKSFLQKDLVYALHLFKTAHYIDL